MVFYFSIKKIVDQENFEIFPLEHCDTPVDAISFFGLFLKNFRDLPCDSDISEIRLSVVCKSGRIIHYERDLLVAYPLFGGRFFEIDGYEFIDFNALKK